MDSARSREILRDPARSCKILPDLEILEIRYNGKQISNDICEIRKNYQVFRQYIETVQT